MTRELRTIARILAVAVALYVVAIPCWPWVSMPVRRGYASLGGVVLDLALGAEQRADLTPLDGAHRGADTRLDMRDVRTGRGGTAYMNVRYRV